MNGAVESHSTVQYVSKPYKRRKTISTPSDNDVIEISPPKGFKSSARHQQLEISDTTERLSPFSKMLINPDIEEKKEPDIISLGTSSPRVQSPISLTNNILPDTFMFPPNTEQGARSPTSPAPHTNGVSIYADANAQSKVCKPLLLIYKTKLAEDMTIRLLQKYSYLFSSSDMESTRSADDKTELKLREFVQDYMIQKKYNREEVKIDKPKIKVTPTVAELKIAKKKEKLKAEEKLQEDNGSNPNNQRTENKENRAEIISDIEVELGLPSDSDDEIQVIDERISQTATIESLQEAYEEVHRKRSLYSTSSQQPPNTFYTYGQQRSSGTPQRNQLDLREPRPTMISHKSQYSGIYNYITKEHDYCHYYSRPKDVQWKAFKEVPPPKKRTLPTPLPSTSLLINALPRPNYVMSEPWLFVPSIDDSRHDSEEYQQALGFETVVRHMLEVKDTPSTKVVECAKCDIDFSSEWFTFMSKRLCKECYKVEVKSRNAIIYLTNVSHIARKAHDRAGNS